MKNSVLSAMAKYNKSYFTEDEKTLSEIGQNDSSDESNSSNEFRDELPLEKAIPRLSEYLDDFKSNHRELQIIKKQLGGDKVESRVYGELEGITIDRSMLTLNLTYKDAMINLFLTEVDKVIFEGDGVSLNIQFMKQSTEIYIITDKKEK